VSNQAQGSVQQVELVVRQPGEPERRVILSAGQTQLGRAEDNDLVLPDIGVSRRHARIVVESSRVLLEDLGSGNGTFIGGERVERVEIVDGTEVVIDPFMLIFHLRRHQSAPQPVAPARSSGGDRVQTAARLVVLAGQRLAASYPLRNEVFTIGRSEGRDIILFDPAASRTHTRIERRADAYWLIDLGSANGTFVNARRAREEPMNHGDVVRIGSTELRFELISGAEAAAMPSQPTPAERPEPVFDPPPGQNFANAPRFESIPAHEIQEVQGRPTTVDFGEARQVAVVPPPAPPKKKGGLGKVIMVLLLLVVLGGGLLLLLVFGGAGAWYYLSSAPVEQVVSPEIEIASLEVPDTPLVATALPAEHAIEVDHQLHLGRLYYSQGRYLESATQFYKALKLAPDHRVARRLGYVSCEQVALDRLRTELRATQTERSVQADVRNQAVKLGRAASKGKGDLVDALATVDLARSFYPDHRELSGLHQRLLALDDERLQARATPGEALSSLRDRLDAQLLEGRRAELSDRPVDAVLAYELNRVLDPQRLTYTWYASGEGLSRIERRLSEDADSALSAGEEAEAAGELAKARVYLEHAAIGGGAGGSEAEQELQPSLEEAAAAALARAEDAEETDAVAARRDYRQVVALLGDVDHPAVNKASERLNALAG